MRDFFLLQYVHSGSGVHSTPGFIPGAARPGRDVDHLPPCSAEVKKECSYKARFKKGPIFCYKDFTAHFTVF
jgi:hypothetical protein